MMLFVVLFAVLCISAQAFNLTEEAFNLSENASSYSGSQAKISVYLSGAAYCGKDNIMSHVFQGPTAGFIVSNVIYDPKSDTQGYVGYLPYDNSIYVAFRGSSSLKNWISDLNAFKTPYTSWPECNCQVHQGFYNAEQRVINDVISYVTALQKKYTSASVKVTGHSLGAALAQLTSMDLLKAGIKNSVYNFGSPRTGDKAYASFATSKIDTWRVVHNKDMVPHLPFTEQMEFYHVCREEFENASGSMKTCDTSCEDPTCGDQFAFSQTNTDDHVVYLGVSLSCSGVSA